MPAGLNAETNDVRLVEIARERVRRFGYARTTVVGIATEAGMTHANVYRYFATKAALGRSTLLEARRTSSTARPHPSVLSIF